MLPAARRGACARTAGSCRARRTRERRAQLVRMSDDSEHFVHTRRAHVRPCAPRAPHRGADCRCARQSVLKVAVHTTSHTVHTHSVRAPPRCELGRLVPQRCGACGRCFRRLRAALPSAQALSDRMGRGRARLSRRAISRGGSQSGRNAGSWAAHCWRASRMAAQRRSVARFRGCRLRPAAALAWSVQPHGFWPARTHRGCGVGPQRCCDAPRGAVDTASDATSSRAPAAVRHLPSRPLLLGNSLCRWRIRVLALVQDARVAHFVALRARRLQQHVTSGG